MRWGSALQMVLLLILPFFKRNIYFWIVFLLGIPTLILNNSRGPWLEFTICFIIYIGYLLLYKKRVKTLILLGVIVTGLAVTGVQRYPKEFKRFVERAI